MPRTRAPTADVDAQHRSSRTRLAQPAQLEKASVAKPRRQADADVTGAHHGGRARGGGSAPPSGRASGRPAAEADTQLPTTTLSAGRRSRRRWRRRPRAEARRERPASASAAGIAEPAAKPASPAAASAAAASAARAAGRPVQFMGTVRGAELGLQITEAQGVVVAMRKFHRGITARMVRRHFEVRGNYKRDALAARAADREARPDGRRPRRRRRRSRSSSSRRCESIRDARQLLVFEGELPGSR